MNDKADLLGKFPVEFRNDCLDGTYGILADQCRSGQRLLGESLDRRLNGVPGAIGLRFELSVKKGLELADFLRRCNGCYLVFGRWMALSHINYSLLGVSSAAGFGADASVFNNAGSFRRLETNSSAPLFPSI